MSISSQNTLTETSRIDHISEYQDVTKHHNLLFSRSKEKKKKIEKRTLSRDKRINRIRGQNAKTNISEINDITTDPKDIKMIRKYYEQLHL